MEQKSWKMFSKLVNVCLSLKVLTNESWTKGGNSVQWSNTFFCILDLKVKLLSKMSVTFSHWALSGTSYCYLFFVRDFLLPFFPAPRKYHGGSSRSSIPSPTRSTVSPTVKFDRSVEGGLMNQLDDGLGDENKELTMSVASLGRFSEWVHWLCLWGLVTGTGVDTLGM